MPAAPPSNAVMDLSRSYGQLLIATFVTTALWGIACVQTLMYFSNYETDSLYLKCLVIALWLLDTVHEIFCIKGLWYMLIPRFGDLHNISIIQPEILYQVIVTGAVTALAQTFFMLRIWRFSDKKVIFPIILAPLVIGQIVGSILFTAKGIGKPESILATPFMRVVNSRNLAMSISIIIGIADVLIATIMSVLLWRGRTGLPTSDRMIVHLINATVGTGACTTTFAVFTSITTGALPNDLFYVFGELLCCTLYLNAVLANLNNRKCIRETKAVVFDVSFIRQILDPSMQFRP